MTHTLTPLHAASRAWLDDLLADLATREAKALGDPDTAHTQLQDRFRLDLTRMSRGKAGDLGYVLIEGHNDPDSVVVFPSPALAVAALDENAIVDAIAEQDAAHIWVQVDTNLDDLVGRTVIFAQ